MSAPAQTIWPDYIAALEPEPSESPIAAVVPAHVVAQVPDTSSWPDKAKWRGVWTSWAGNARLCDLKVVVESFDSTGATNFYAMASARMGTVSERLSARFEADELQATLVSGMKLALRMRNDHIVEVVGSVDGQVRFGGVLSNRPFTNRTIERVAVDLIENEQPVLLECVIYQPLGAGPFPTLMFNHGSTGYGNDPTLFTSTWSSPGLAKFFNDRGWMVVFPQRRGRGKSGGLYDEGFDANHTRYSCDPKFSLPGLDRAMDDIHAAAGYLAGRADVDPKRMLIGGQSRGGIASIAYAGKHPDRFIVVINFVGGWESDDCWSANKINQNGFTRGAHYPKPTLWLYAENDPFYKVSHSRKNFEVFQMAGGNGAFYVFRLGAGQSGHGLIAQPAIWQDTVQTYLDRVGKF